MVTAFNKVYSVPSITHKVCPQGNVGPKRSMRLGKCVDTKVEQLAKFVEVCEGFMEEVKIEFILEKATIEK